MKRWILDTDHVSLYQRQHPLVIQRVLATPPELLAVTIVTLEEQFRGWFSVIQKAGRTEQLVFAYTQLRATSEYFCTANVLDFDQNTYEQYLRLQRLQLRVGSQDLKIAAIVLTQDSILVTRNRRDFEKIPGLVLENWAIASQPQNIGSE
ncbi:MAG: type II toxin-antitoxin system VapC family toxin [Oculatellaceae cyanobacterium Prado106]|nr:type II toxin-antitoxin system VapC family toxin [Oculatellaceae cyanobacterium Prado106]